MSNYTSRALSERIYEEGRAAALAGLLATACPYGLITHRLDWVAGYNSVKR